MGTKKKPRKIDANELRQLLAYESDSGVFTWKYSRNQTKKGSIAGHVNDRGYLVISVRACNYNAHRLAFLYMTGEWPVAVVDHRDGDKLNNRWLNLRDVSHSMNLQNQRKASKNNKLGILGVVQRGPNRFRADIMIEKRQVYLGTFDTAAKASQAYLDAKRVCHPGNTL